MRLKQSRHNNYRCKFEQYIASQLPQDTKYEQFKIIYFKPISKHYYLPDFVLPNGIIIETKGFFSTSDRKKHLLIKNQYPELDIRFIFTNAKQRLNKKSKTTYGDWCEKFGFLYSSRTIPKGWLK